MGMATRRERKRSVKQRIRDTKRFLNKEDLPETVRLTKGRVLKCLEQELGEKQREVKARKLAKKYRMVKFFDKRKVSRKLKAKLKELSECEEDKRVAILSCIEQLRRELNYVVHYPPGEKYLALYPSSESSDERATLKKEQFLQQVADMVESGEAEDASASFLPPTLRCKSSARQEHMESSEPAGAGDHQLPPAEEKREWPRRKRLISEEELEGVCDVLDSKRKLLQGDDFFIQDCIT